MKSSFSKQIFVLSGGNAGSCDVGQGYKRDHERLARDGGRIWMRWELFNS